MRNRLGLILALACVLVLSGPGQSRAQVVDKAKEETKAIKAMVEESVGWYRVFSDPSVPEAMPPHRVLRWRNPTRGTQESEGVFVLWVNHGRPEASASIYPWEGKLVHDFASLFAQGLQAWWPAREAVWDLVAGEPRRHIQRGPGRTRTRRDSGRPAHANEGSCRSLPGHDDRLEARQIGS